MTTHNIRILHEANATLESMIQQGHLLPITEKIPGVAGQVYRTADNAGITAIDHFSLQIANKVVPANMYALPPEEYAGLVKASPQFAQHRLEHLVTPLLHPMTSAQQGQWLREVTQALEADPRVDPTPRMLSQPTNPARWRPEATRLSRSGCGWLLTLGFDEPVIDCLKGLDLAAAGVDIGLHNLAVTAFASGAVHRAPGVQDIRLTDHDVSTAFPKAKELERNLDLLQHAAARAAFQDLIRTLLSSASSVCVEDLRYTDMCDSFKQRSRSLGIRDWMMSWLPQRLHAQGIPLMRIRPDHTSQFCSLTHRWGERDGRTFKDGNGHITDADLNAARNILHLGLAQRIARELGNKGGTKGDGENDRG
ncbi:zinc ribbon domain-containing protein [Deinococcus antarcticus]|uniref:Zinc ribbon domain-containing protein n=1 Tax=Deinococcus antarcticus TaxID=1298767 RepID=A0ABV8A6F0_9DEIO